MRRTSNTTRYAAAAAIAVAAALGLTSCGGSNSEPRTVRYEILPGSAQTTEDSGPTERAGRTIRARVGDTLLVVNHDDALHIVVGKPVRRGQTRSIPLSEAGRFDTSCTAHKRRSATIVVTER